MLRRVLITCILLALILGTAVASFNFLLSLRKPPKKSEILRLRSTVLFTTAKRESFQEEFSGYGQVRAFKQTQVAAQVNGVILWVSPKLEAGARVIQGEKLVKLDSRDLQKALSMAKSSLTQSELEIERIGINLKNLDLQLAITLDELDAAQREMNRVEGLRDSTSESRLDNQRLSTSRRRREVLKIKWQIESNRIALQAAYAGKNLRKAQFDKARNDLQRTTITAPYSGRIKNRYAQVGSYIIAGTPLFCLVDVSRVEVAISLGASHFDEVEIGSKVKLYTRKEKKTMWTAIERKSAVVGKNRTFEVYCQLRRNFIDRSFGFSLESPIPSGSFVTAYIEGPSHESVFVVPRAAFLGMNLFVAKPSKKAGEAIIEMRQPHVFRFLSDVALVDAGLADGEKIVVSNLGEIANGSEVIAVEKKTDKYPLKDGRP